MIFESFVNMSKILSIKNNSSTFWNILLCDSSSFFFLLVRNCKVCKNSKALSMDIGLEINNSREEWCFVGACQYLKNPAEELSGFLERQWLSTLTHINIKRI